MVGLPSPLWARRYLLNFNSLALVLLSVQNAGYLVLMCYSQGKGKDSPPAAVHHSQGGEDKGSTVQFKASHFLATTEVMKLFLSLLWCALDEARAMQHDCGSCETSTPPTAALRVQSGRRGSVVTFAETPNSISEASCHRVYSLDDIAEKDTESVDHIVRLQTLVSQKKFCVLFLSRMRHAIGLDHKYKETLLMIVPAIVYAMQGLLLIYALKLLDPTLFQVLYQVRILFMAVMMRVVLDFRLSPIRWGALVTLMFGITLAQMGAQKTRGDTAASKAGDTAQSRVERAVVAHRMACTWSMEGTLAALAGGFLSAFSGVFMEFVVKKRGNHFHLSARNVHLAFFSAVYFFIVFLCEIFQAEGATGVAGSAWKFRSTFFDGFTGLVWFLVMLQAIGGILVALVVRNCDNIVKSFSTAFSIVLSGTASVFLLHTPLSGTFLGGSFLVLTSITMYTVKK
ncbi:cmp-sialic acid transporter, putative [Leishmania tarentolae]|uniref:Cmp-sialic acid transporter, putative n=1 Tax=Leishmania tarentolae TaxID=5689 RepID=A0A640KHU6_LEITA|nr:cmp-sialic acid transporter, putative [Leishmania tarentolae]